MAQRAAAASSGRRATFYASAMQRFRKDFSHVACERPELMILPPGAYVMWTGAERFTCFF